MPSTALCFVSPRLTGWTQLEVSALVPPSYIETNGVFHAALDFNSTSTFGDCGNYEIKLIVDEIFCLIVFRCKMCPLLESESCI